MALPGAALPAGWWVPRRELVLPAIVEPLPRHPAGKRLRKRRAPREHRCGRALRVLHAVSAEGSAPAATQRMFMDRYAHHTIRL